MTIPGVEVISVISPIVLFNTSVILSVIGIVCYTICWALTKWGKSKVADTISLWTLATFIAVSLAATVISVVGLFSSTHYKCKINETVSFTEICENFQVEYLRKDNTYILTPYGDIELE